MRSMTQAFHYKGPYPLIYKGLDFQRGRIKIKTYLTVAKVMV